MALPETPAGSEAGFTASERPEDGEQPGEAVTAAMFPAMRDALAEQKQTPLSIDDSYLMQGIRL